MRLTILFFASILILAGCDGCKTNPNTSDTTPAVIDWTIQNQTTGEEKKLNGNASYSARLGDQLRITACADDNGGIKELEHYTNSSYSCSSGNLGQNVGPGLVVPTTTPLGLDADGKAWKRYCAIMNLTLNFNCQSGFSFSSGGAVAHMKAKNYGNVNVSATLTINVSR